MLQLVLLEADQHPVVDIAPELERQKGIVRALQPAPDLGGGLLHQISEESERFFVVAHLDGDDAQDVTGPVLHQRAAMAVINDAARRFHTQTAGTVLLRLRQILFALEDLQVEELPGQHDKGTGDDKLDDAGGAVMGVHGLALDRLKQG